MSILEDSKVGQVFFLIVPQSVLSSDLTFVLRNQRALPCVKAYHLKVMNQRGF